MGGKKRLEREELLRIIGLCLTVEMRGIDPFEVDVKKALGTIRKYLPEWELPEDFKLDVEALSQITKIIQLQGEWLKHRSSSLYIDPLLIEFKIKLLDADSLANIFIRAWRPIIEMERLSPGRVKEAVEYWNQLLPIDERWKKLPRPPRLQLESTTVDDLIRLGLLSEMGFNEILRLLWEELTERAKGDGRVEFWDFISAETYSGTVARAYLTSFLVTYGYATLEVAPLEDEAFLTPQQTLREGREEGGAVSVPLPIDYKEWERMRRERRA